MAILRKQGQAVSNALLGCYSNFTFLKGASHPDEMVAQAAALGWAAVGIADVNSLAGIVRAHVAARDHQIRLVVGARLRLSMALMLSFIRATALVMKLYQCC